MKILFTLFCILLALASPAPANMGMGMDMGMGAGGIDAIFPSNQLVMMYLNTNLVDTLASRSSMPAGTVTRATTRTRTNPYTGLVEEVAINTGAFEAEGLHFSPGGTNLLEYSQNFAEWTASNITPVADAVGPDGVTNSAYSLTAGDANGTIKFTSTTTASQDYNFSVYLKRKTGTGNIDITLNDGSTWTTKTITSSWAKYSITASLANPVVGIRIVTSGDAVYAWGAQLTATKFVLPYIPTAGATVSCSGDAIAWVVSATLQDIFSDAIGDANSEGTFIVDVEPGYNFADLVAVSSPFINGEDGASFLYHNQTFLVGIYDGTAGVVVGGFAATVGQEYRFSGSWSKSGNVARLGYKLSGSWTFATSTYDGSINGGVATMATGGGHPGPYHIKNLRFFNTALSQAYIEANF